MGSVVPRIPRHQRLNRGAGTFKVRHQRDRSVFIPLSNLLKSAAGTCPFCHQKAGILSREHQGCRRTHQAGWNEMVELAAHAARSHEFHPNSLQVSLAEIAKRSYGDASTVARALEEGVATPRQA